LTENQEFKDFLTGVFKDYISIEAKDYLANQEAFRLDSDTGDYRTRKELTTIETGVMKKAEQMSSDFLDELHAKGISSPKDYEEKWRILEKTLMSYRDKLFKWLRDQ